MNTKILKLVTLLLALLMCVSCFVACDGNGDNGNDTGTGTGTGSGTSTGDDTVDETSPEIIYRPASVNYDNYEYVIVAPNQNEFGNGHFCAVEGAEDIINESLRRRETLMADKYGVVMKLNTTYGSEINKTVIQKNRTKQYFADLVFYTATQGMTSAQSGCFYDLNSLEELNLEAPYWDQRIQQDYRIGDMLFQVVGDIDTLDELVTFGFIYGVVAYNSMNYQETYGSPYDLVRNGQWTFNLMLTMATPYTTNVDEDPNMGIGDKWGLLTECQATYYLFIGTGIKPISSSNGELQLNLKDSITYNKAAGALEEILRMASNEKVAYAERDFAGSYGDAAAIFKANRALFRTSSLSTTMGLGDMQDDFGILPIPMYVANQEGGYYNMVAATGNWPLMIPKSVGDSRVSKVANIAEIISYHSRFGDDEPLYESFFERLTSLKICRSDNDKEMLMLIFDSKVFDFDQTTKVMDIYTQITNMASNKTDVGAVSTMLSGAVSTGDTKLNSIIETFNKSNSSN